MKQSYTKLFAGVALTGLLMFVSCQSPYKLTRIEGSVIQIDSVWDVHQDAQAVKLLAPYKASVDSMMYRVVGTSEMTMKSGLPESLLSNLVTDVLRSAATPLLGKPADMGLANVGGLRNILSEGEITCGNIYEILPFENSLCIVTVTGTVLKDLFASIAAVGGNGVSGVHLEITKDGKLLNATVQGRPVDDNQLYTVATIDYLADGNDGMIPLIQAEKRDCPKGATLRGLFMDYVEQQSKAGKKVTSRMDGRITVK